MLPGYYLLGYRLGIIYPDDPNGIEIYSELLELWVFRPLCLIRPDQTLNYLGPF